MIIDEKEYCKSMFLIGAWHGMAAKYQERLCVSTAEKKLFEDLQKMTFEILNGEEKK